MDIIVTGRHMSVSDRLREQVEERIATIEKLRDRVIRVEVEFTAVGTKNQPSEAIEVEITLRSKGPVIRAEANAEDKMAAFEKALERIKVQLRKAADRRKTHRGLRATSIAPDITSLPAPAEPEPESDDPVTQTIAGLVVTGDGPLIVREKEFDAVPLTLAQALDEMELVGHDFFLYLDAATRKPSVVYRRKAYNYGVIHLNVQE